MTGHEIAFAVDWHEVALGTIAVLLTIAGWVWTNTVRVVMSMRKELTDHLVNDATKFGAIETQMAQNHIEVLREIHNSL